MGLASAGDFTTAVSSSGIEKNGALKVTGDRCGCL
jgi:hypothetical protein